VSFTAKVGVGLGAVVPYDTELCLPEGTEENKKEHESIH
jgi:hypothetical protein